MGDKFDGVLAAEGPAIAAMQDDMNIAEALQGLTIHETLVTKDEDENTVLLRAVQNPSAGGIMMVREDGHDHSHIMHEAIRRSQMTSMLADEARCSKYKDAIKYVLEKRPGATVLDIGTGTGLLAMFAAKAGASHVTAVEMFEPLADLAVQVVQANCFQEKISVVCASSTDISVDRGEKDKIFLHERADVLMTEIFDSALLGENCIDAIRHAHANLLKEGASVIPARARLYATVINSETFYRFRNLPRDFPLHRDGANIFCGGGSIGIPVHLDGITQGVDFEVLTDPFEVFEFDFTMRNIPRYRQKSRRLMRKKNGKSNALLTWWELDLTESGDIVYSTKAGVENWQDHWLQVIYPLSGCEDLSRTDSAIAITMEHDNKSFAFALGLDEEPSLMCQCGFHSIMTPSRIHEIGDLRSLKKLSSQLGTAVAKSKGTKTNGSHNGTAIRCVDVSDNSICAALASRVECERRIEVFSVEEDNEVSSFLFSRIADKGKTANHVFVEYDPLSAFIERELEKRESSDNWEGFDIIMSEPFTRAMHAFPIATLANLMVQRLALSVLLKDNFTVVPSVARIQAQLVSFPRNTIQNSFKTIENVQGLDLQPYARLLQDEQWDQSQRRISLPLFQYNAIPCSEKACVGTIGLCAEDDRLCPNPSQTWIAMTSHSDVDAVSLRVEYDDTPASRISRSEIIWLSETEKLDLSRTSGLMLACAFLRDAGSWEIHVVPPQR